MRRAARIAGRATRKCSSELSGPAARRDERSEKATRSGAHPPPLDHPLRHQKPRNRAPSPPDRRRNGGGAEAWDQAAPRVRRGVRESGPYGGGRHRDRRDPSTRSISSRRRASRRDPRRRARGDRRRRNGYGEGDGRRHAEIQRTRGRQARESDRPRGVGRIDAVLETLEFPQALARVAAHAAGALGAARVASRRPETDVATIRAALAQVAELAALLITDESIRAEPVPDITQSLELFAVAGSALEAPAFAELTVALAAMRVVAADLKRLSDRAPRTAHLRVDPPLKELETKLVQSISPDGQVLDSASKDLARARQRVREARKHVTDKLGAILGSLDQTERAPDAAVTVRGGRYVIPIRSTARARVGGIVHDESATRGTVFVEPPEIIELGNELRAAESAEQREVLRVLRELTDLLRPHASAIAAAWEMCIAFDDLCARARYAVEVNGFVPEIGGHLKIRNGGHPLLIPPLHNVERGSGGEAVVPFDLELAPDERTVLVSGPNTGGKTVLIKAVGLLALLAHSGVIPPIGPHSSLPVFTEVFAECGPM